MHNSLAKHNNIRELRGLRQLSQAALARKLRVTQQYISLIEARKREPMPDVARRIREILGGAILTPITILREP